MSTANKCIFYNKREAAASDVGPNLAEVGVGGTRVPVKFNNGFKGASSADYENFNETNFNPNSFILTMYVKMDVNIVNGAVPGSGDRGGWWSWGAVSPDYVKSSSIETGTRFWFLVNSVPVQLSITTGFNITAGVVTKVTFAFNRLGIDGAEVTQVYLNKVKVFSSTTVPDEQTSVADREFRLNNQKQVPAWFFKGAQDEVQLYSNITLADINNVINNDNEGLPLSRRRFNPETEESMEVLWLTSYTLWETIADAGTKTTYYESNGNDYKAYVVDANNIAVSAILLKNGSVAWTDFDTTRKAGATAVNSVAEVKSTELG